MPEFEYNGLLYLLILLPLVVFIFLYALNKRKKAIKKMGDKVLVDQLLLPFKRYALFARFLLLLFSITFLILAIANVRIATGSKGPARNGIDVMIALDVSKSMLAQDIQPSRLDKAKLLVSRLIDKLPDDRIGIVVFAGKAYLQMPLTADHSAAKMYLSAATPDAIPTQGTVIGDALTMCYRAFDSKEKKYKAVILISDGEDHDEKANKIASDMNNEGVIIYTIGVGSSMGSNIIDPATGQPKTDVQGNVVVTKLNEKELKDIAKSGGGTYQLLINSDLVANNLEKQIGTMDQRIVKDNSLNNYKSFFPYLIAMALIGMLIEFFMTERRSLKRMAKYGGTGVILLLWHVPAWAQAGKENIAEGNKLYNNKNYSAAEKEYEVALSKNPNSRIALYNMGNAAYKNKKIDEAIAAYDKAIPLMGNTEEKANAYYNKAVVLQNENRVDECIIAYKNALKLWPNHEDARQNLQKALRKKKQDEEKKKKDQENKDKDKQQQPKPQPSKMTKKEAEEKLEALMQQEKNLQDKMNKADAQSVNKPEKDW
ncbi:MAG: hypothetical protein ABS68_03490 [Niastella sp. SCN 39-18]|nr:VWA domain-containing protein [Sphingobacteriales bacterium]ODT54033.1 MAG: hypothetical protein ABS68_03490 [Niastella sp. SCN 39-18]OJW09809.1 MAG: hypothetical protein BGO53_08195 [Sphingobacteriales bacterium 39-19]